MCVRTRSPEGARDSSAAHSTDAPDAENERESCVLCVPAVRGFTPMLFFWNMGWFYDGIFGGGVVQHIYSCLFYLI